MVVGRHSWFKTIFNPAYVPSKSEIEIEVLSQVQRTRSLFSRADLDAQRRHFTERKTPIYAVARSGGRSIRRDARSRAGTWTASSRRSPTTSPSTVPWSRKATCGSTSTRRRPGKRASPTNLVRPGTPVNELQRSGAMSQVVILDANWRWTSERAVSNRANRPGLATIRHDHERLPLKELNLRRGVVSN